MSAFSLNRGGKESLSHKEARGMFLSFADQELAAPEAQKLRRHLESCEDCLAGWHQYEDTVRTLRGVTREKAPPALASLVMRRVRRNNRPAVRYARLVQLQRVPVEAVIPILLGVAVAAFIVMAAP